MLSSCVMAMVEAVVLQRGHCCEEPEKDASLASALSWSVEGSGAVASRSIVRVILHPARS